MMMLSMTAPMIALMRYHKSSWRYCIGMTLAMLVPVGLFTVLAQFDLITIKTLHIVGEVAMFLGMIICMLYRRGWSRQAQLNLRPTIQIKEKTMTTVTYSVPSISCGGCVRMIQMGVRGLDGVQSIKVNAATKQVEVVFDAPATEDKIKSLLAEINYPVAA